MNPRENEIVAGVSQAAQVEPEADRECAGDARATDNTGLTDEEFL